MKTMMVSMLTILLCGCSYLPTPVDDVTIVLDVSVGWQVTTSEMVMVYVFNNPTEEVFNGVWCDLMKKTYYPDYYIESTMSSDGIELSIEAGSIVNYYQHYPISNELVSIDVTFTVRDDVESNVYDFHLNRPIK